MPRAFVTGIAGFAGSHLAAHLLGEGWDVRGADLSGALGGLQKSDERLILDTCDLRNAEQIASLVSRAKPDIVFHLAAVSFVPAAEHAPAAAFEMNVLGTINLLEACRASVAKARVVLVSSAEVYGKVPPEEMPLRESRPPAPASIYALTKRCAEESALYYRRVHGLDIIVLRPFNHIGPRQNPNFVTSSFALQIAEIEAGQRAAALEVGNLEAARDFTDVHDM
ncbi:MAG: GDP-mannose 4,6-dehydratase, partial [Candidatus Aureabacteria bacterium]|nr:GDP-mannose 4,6-dehydratase [Candidatus Auribacterota bacterium]